ncbi:regulatory protein (GGDEF domain) [Legionella beliardensis]|uniref:Regulatory protein (GGDEF domain) n=1 Tax=Legionella beliardensis TaxID=91822 RepID=A0A378I3G2_9GAMM|nr:BLUF domain-containing protein [Legionella beliardensis]STX29241.1 regulatory protein (GGDEF domain) [Legionella beliardensis]
MSDLYHLIYKSEAKKPLDACELTELAKLARFKNFIYQLSGLLIYSEQRFFQVLEGKLSSIELIYQKIEEDDRHENIVLLTKEPIASRTFWRWNMGLTIIDDDSDIKQQLVNYMQSNINLAAANKNDAGFILEAFSRETFQNYIQ